VFAVIWRSPLISHFPEGSDLFSLFQISLENYFDIKFRLWYEHRLDPNWIESIPFYEYQIWVDKLNEAIEKKNTESVEKDGKKQVLNLTKK
jgi:hypothetical protein